MKRKQFLQTSLLATGTYFLPNVVLALDKPHKKKTADLIPDRMLVALPDKSDYKYNTDGEVFINTQLSFYDADKQLIPLPERHYITHQADGYGCPTLYVNGNDYYVFVTTLFKSYKMDGFVYKYNRQDGFVKQTIYQHENMGWFAFWGQLIDGKPTLYHYNYANSSMMRSQPLEAEHWETERLYICTPEQTESLYASQLKDVNYKTQAHQYGFTYPKIKDGFYDFLKFLDQINELEKTAQKNIEADKEAKSPTVWTSKRVPNTIREIRNRQSLANETGGCGCADKMDYLTPNEKHIRLIKVTNTKAEAILHNNLKYYPTTISYHDLNNKYHKLPETLYCLADSETKNYPVLCFDGEQYHVFIKALEPTKNIVQGYLFAHSPSTDFTRNVLNNYNEEAIKPFFERNSVGEIALLSQLPHESHYIETALADNSQSKNTDKQLGSHYRPQIVYPFLLDEQPNILQVVWCEGDDLTYAKTKPEILYKEIPGTRIEVPNMPAYKTQDTMGECRAFSMGAIVQKFICDIEALPDCKNPPAEFDISYFGLMMYTHAEKGLRKKTFNPFGDEMDTMYQILNNYTTNYGKTYLNSCNPFSKMMANFTTNGIVTASDETRYNTFVDYLKTMYSNWKSFGRDDLEPRNTDEMLNYINNSVGLTLTWPQLKTALMKETFGQYLYSMFFGFLDPIKCKPIIIPPIEEINAYPYDADIATSADIKEKIIQVLKKTQVPVLTPTVCLKWSSKNECDEHQIHSLVISGYRRVRLINNPSAYKDLFKVHNSWGPSWQRENNDGWIDADAFTTGFFIDTRSNRIDSGAVVWIK